MGIAKRIGRIGKRIGAGIAVIVLSAGCAHRAVVEEPVASSPAPIKATATKIKYVYVETPSTVSAMTTAPLFERTTTEKASVGSEILRILWPLLTLMLAGAVFIAVLFAEHVILNRQLAKRASLRTRLREEKA